MKSITTWILAVGVLAPAMAAGAGEEPQPLDVFLMIGQSNMVGSGQAAELPEGLKGPNEKVLVFSGGRWAPMAPKGRFGPEVSFAAAMAKELGRPVGIIKYAVGGTNLAHQWNPTVEGNLYHKAVAMVAAAGKARPIRVLGACWMQGERDSLSGPMAEAYAKNLALLVQSLRRDGKAPAMTFVCGRVNPPANRYKFVETVRKAQMTCPLPRTAWVNCDDLPKNRDNLHYNSKGLVEMGRRFAMFTLQLMKQQPATQPAAEAAP